MDENPAHDGHDGHGAYRPAPAANGTLAKTPLVHLLVYALDRKLSGTIELLAPDRRSAVVLFVGGEPAKVRTSEPVAYLGRVLLELGYIDEQQLDRSLADLARLKATSPRLHGELLVEQGVLDEAKLWAGLKEQTARKLRHVAGLPGETAYAYYAGFDALGGWGGHEVRGFDPVPMLWGMLREYAPWEHVNGALARVASSPLRIARGADVGRLALAREEVAALELLRTRPLRIADLARAAQLNDRTAQLLGYLLLVTRQVEVLPSTASPPPPGETVASQPSPARSFSPSPSASPSPAPSPPRSPVPPAQPARASRPPGGGWHPRPPGARASRVAPPEPPDTLLPELAERWRDIVQRAGTIDRADYFMMLDISRDATRAQVEEAFFTLAKRWHPDRLPGELAPVRDACSRVFGRMSEARSTLGDEEQRARYMRLLADGSGSPEMQETVAKVVDAATSFQKAEVCFKRNDLPQAEHFCRKALELDDSQADYHALLAWLVALKPENQSPEKTLDCIQMLDRAAQLSSKCEKAYFWRGMLYKRIGNNKDALKDFRRVVEINPRNIDAAREVRLYQMRGTGASSPPPKRSSPQPPKTEEQAKGGGLFGRLFKKP